MQPIDRFIVSSISSDLTGSVRTSGTGCYTVGRKHFSSIEKCKQTILRKMDNMCDPILKDDRNVEISYSEYMEV